MLPERKQLPHEIPPWVNDGAKYFITICAQPRDSNQLCHATVSAELFDAIKHVQARGDWWIHLTVLMPDHLHAIMSFAPEPGLQKSIAAWKRYTAVNSNIDWQRDFFDHRLRKDESFSEKAHYIRMNPVRAGLVEKHEDWPYVLES